MRASATRSRSIGGAGAEAPRGGSMATRWPRSSPGRGAQPEPRGGHHRGGELAAAEPVALVRAQLAGDGARLERRNDPHLVDRALAEPDDVELAPLLRQCFHRCTIETNAVRR